MHKYQFYGGGLQNNLGSLSLATYSFWKGIKIVLRFSNSCASNTCATKIH